MQLAGSPQALNQALAGAALASMGPESQLAVEPDCSVHLDARCQRAAKATGAGLHRDFVFIFVYAAVGIALCLVGARSARIRRRFQRRKFLFGAAWAGAVAALFDLTENWFLFRALEPRSHGLAAGTSDIWVRAAAVAATAKWALVIVFVVGVVTGMLTFLFNAFPVPKPDPSELDRSRHWREPLNGAWPPGERGICFSGGGIRSASFCLGALQRLEEGTPDRGSAVTPARYVAAVSGGGYLAGAAQLLSKRRPNEVPFKPGSGEEDHLRRHANYLADTASEWVGAMLQAVLKLLANLVLVGLAVWILAESLGWLGRLLLSSASTADRAQPSWPPIPEAVGFALLVMAPTAILLAALRRRHGTVRWDEGRSDGLRQVVQGARKVKENPPAYRSGLAASLSIAFGGAAAVLAITAIVLPFLDAAGQRVALGLHLPRGVAAGGWPAALLAAVLARVQAKALSRETSGGAAPANLAQPASKPKGRLPFAKNPAELLAGPLLMIVALGYLSFLAAQARADGPTGMAYLGPVAIKRWALLAIAAVVFFGFGLLVDAVSWSMHRFYKRRLWSAFAYDPEKRGERDWSQTTKLSDDGVRVKGRPELVLCGAAQVSGPSLAPPGRRAVSWTFGPQWVGGPEIGWCKTTKMEKVMAGRRRKPKGRAGEVSLFGAIAISGAAFGSAMGRHSKGTLDALLALANARLGVWLPNPRYVAKRCKWFGRRHLGYLAREVFGRYSPDAPWVLVSDGGHYENLGLVELFRRRCTRILCLDASGASGGAPTTVAEALRLAEEELGVVVHVDTPWTSLPGQSNPPFQAKRLSDALTGRLASEPVVVGSFTYPSDSGVPDEHRHGWLVIGRAVLTPTTPWPLLSYAAGNPEFPNDATADQWFDHEQFANYRLLGRHVAERMLKSIDEDGRGWWSGDGGESLLTMASAHEADQRGEDAPDEQRRRTRVAKGNGLAVGQGDTKEFRLAVQFVRRTPRSELRR